MRYLGAKVAFAVSLLVAGIGGSVLFWTWDRGYFGEFARDARLEDQTYHFPSGGRRLSLADVRAVDGELRDRLLCGCVASYAIEIRGEPIFTAREDAHLRDVGGLFRALLPSSGLATLLALALGAALSRERRSMARTALIDAAIVVLAGAASALAFEPAFLLFHRVFFPQGNYLFDPATDNLVLLYPEGYWLGVTLRVGATFLLIALAVATLASLPIRFRAQPKRGGLVSA